MDRTHTLTRLIHVIETSAKTLPGLTYELNFCGDCSAEYDPRVWFDISYASHVSRVAVDLDDHYIYIESAVRSAILEAVIYYS